MSQEQTFVKYVRNPELCTNCQFCTTVVSCPSPQRCIGCGSCYLACPYEAIEPIKDDSPRKMIRIYVDGKEFHVPEFITVKKALELVGFTFTKFPEKDKFFSPCETGGCYACAMIIDGELKPTCHTPVRDRMTIITNVSSREPLRIVEGFQPHPVGGVGTPWWVKRKGYYIEVACFAAGCNLRCPQCQNYHVTYDSSTPPMTPKEAAKTLTYYRRKYGVDRMAISGGKPTLNRRWLIEFFRELKQLNPDKKARLHLDTNTTLLTPDYIDELIEAGVTDIGADLKALRIETFMLITGITDKNLAKKYLETSWKAVKYIVDNYYPDKVFLGIGIPYNKAFYPTLDEMYEIGRKIAELDPNIQVVVLDYRPEFRRRDIEYPTVEEMLRVKKILEDAGLNVVIVQTRIGHVGPGDIKY